ncbi:MAG: DUF423 domain-containing protein [Bacteroidetes bacterium]|nr:DUF423 domain-containing protein [Bacteroidota bacterium]
MLTQKRILIIGGVLAGLAVALGAFGAHALKALLTQNGRIDTFELATRYHFYHAFAVLIVGVLYPKAQSNWWRRSAWMFLLGILLFSGSLYVMAVFNTTKVALITPLGGVCFLTGWAMFVMAVAKADWKD